MASTTAWRLTPISVVDYRCTARLGEEPFVECHDRYSVAFVRTGSFGYQARGESFELVAGSILVGYPGDEYVCTHDHVCGDECLSVSSTRRWSTRWAPPLTCGESARCRRCPS